MTMVQDLPANIVKQMGSIHIAEFATISKAGVPIDTVSAVFPSPGLTSFDFGTGVAYPAKAERARRNPKTGLLIEGKPDEPVISIAGMSAVRDSDLQANVHRYISELGYNMPGNPDWSLAHKAVWYWSRIIIQVAPARVLWWDTPADMDKPPHRWDAPAGTVYPPSDPAAPGAVSAPSEWAQQTWQEAAKRAITRGMGGHLTFVDGEGFPLPIRAKNIAQTETGFTMEMPKGLPWPPSGKASFSFLGLETFVGEVTTANGVSTLKVERVLPTMPMVGDLKQLWEPTADTYEQLMSRLRHEAARRGVPIPTIPAKRPPVTELYKQRLTYRGLPIPADD
jgi:hypothetical protein